MTEVKIPYGEEKEKSRFDDFQLEEYKNISNSHFESVKQGSIFFRYYLLILGAPLLIFNLFSKKDSGLTTFLSGKEIDVYYSVAFYYFIAVSLIGFFVFLYIINLRLDSLLYAKAVNKVRRYFYEKSDLTITDFESFLHLPIVSSKPKYFERTFFIPLFLVCSIINCGFLLSAFYLKTLNGYPYVISWNYFDFPITNVVIITLTIIFFATHYFGYYTLSSNKNNSYLKDLN